MHSLAWYVAVTLHWISSSLSAVVSFLAVRLSLVVRLRHCHPSWSMSAVGSFRAVRLIVSVSPRLVPPSSTFVFPSHLLRSLGRRCPLLRLPGRGSHRDSPFFSFVLFICWLLWRRRGVLSGGARTVLPCLGPRLPRLHWVGLLAAVSPGGLGPPRPRRGVFGRRRFLFGVPGFSAFWIRARLQPPRVRGGFRCEGCGEGRRPLCPPRCLFGCEALLACVMRGVLLVEFLSFVHQFLARLCSLGARGAPVVAWFRGSLGSRGGFGVGRLGLRPQRGVAGSWALGPFPHLLAWFIWRWDFGRIGRLVLLGLVAHGGRLRPSPMR